MSAESELVIAEESSAPTKDSPEVKERFWALNIAITCLSRSIGLMNFDRQTYKRKILQKKRLFRVFWVVWESAIAVDRKYKHKFLEF